MRIKRQTAKDLYYNKVIDMYQNKKLRGSEIAEFFPVTRKTIYEWINTFVVETQQKEEDEMRKKNALQAAADDLLRGEISSLKSQLQTLQEELRETRMRADLYNEIINVAEEQFKIDIRKKVGTKR